MAEQMKILLVDDAKAIRFKVKRMLLAMISDNMDIQVDEAEDGEKGVQLFESGRHDLVLLDIHMPKLDGLGALKAIRGMDSEAMVVMVTSDSAAATVKVAIDSGANGFLTKPFTHEKLTKVLQSIDKWNKAVGG